MSYQPKQDFGPWSVSDKNPIVYARHNHDSDKIEKEISTISFPFLLALKMYKKFISGNTGRQCAMYPSCSSFSVMAIEKHGPILGIFMTADRLLRCVSENGDICDLIQVEGSSYRFFDPVELNDFWF
jgi:putative membrane protein insertion efficiency factor